MTNLYVVLILIGILIIAAVFVYNWWQERKYYQQAEKSFSPLKSDALLDEPTFNIDTTKNDFEDTIIDESSLKNTKTSPQAPTNNIALASAEVIASTEPSAEAAIEDEFLPDNVSINEAYAQLTQARVASQTNLNTQATKSAHLDDIKAIFDNTFGYKNKVEPIPAHLDDDKASEQVMAPDNQPPTPEQPPASEADDNAINTADNDVHREEVILLLPAMLQAQMDYTAVLHLTREMPASTIVSTLIGQFEGYDKPVFIHTLTSNALELSQDMRQLWTILKEVSPHQKIIKVACSIQLADRSGAISRNLLSRFQQVVDGINEQLNATLDWQDTGDIVAKANALDAFCIEVDKTVGFHLVHGEQGAFTGTKLKGLAEAQGFRLSTDGSFKYYDERGQVLFIMFNRENFRFNQEMLRNSVVKGITFQLDIPHVSKSTQAFNQMIQAAKQMNIALNAALVDESNKLLGDDQLDKIRQQLTVIQSTMLERGIVPGSDSAMRLFS
ncbi:MAG: cell division protein ZipA C-terminal FtsZ-binding domain-containing protein [Methylophilaceae bacterium]